MRRLHAPLEFGSVQNGYYYTDPSYRLGYFPTTEGELVALLVAAQVMDQYRGTPFEQDLRKALAKISEILPATIEVPLDALTGCLSVLPRVQTTYDPEIFRVLVTAVRQSRQLSMVYWTAGRNETQRRTFDPYDLVLAPDDDWCLIGHCHLRNDIRLFKVQRVRSAVETGKCFCRPAGFRARDYMAESFGTIRGEGEGDFHVVLRFTRAYAGRIAEKQWHAGQVVEPQPDGSLILRLHVNDLRLIKRWVMYRAAECEVLEPEELIAMVVSDLKAVGRIYRRARTR
ncbi:MAG: WYL domain-containing protein [Isosphaeraceae bacterium]